ncbi:MAG: hypothetical protein K8S54_13950 [Spirochaetia bacterium]|nr:hypothetical protein [Spirochaetia bacterium]
MKSPNDEPSISISTMLGLAAAFSIRDAAMKNESEDPPLAPLVTAPTPGGLPPIAFIPIDLQTAGQLSSVSGIGSDDTNVYVGSSDDVLAFNRASGARTVLASSGFVRPDLPNRPSFSEARYFRRAGDYLYFFSNEDRIERLFLGPDKSGVIETVVRSEENGGFNGIKNLAGNSRSLFWIRSVDESKHSLLMAKSLTDDSLPIFLGSFPGELKVIAADSVLYLVDRHPAGFPLNSCALKRYELSTGVLSVLQASISCPLGLQTLLTSDRFYWAGDDKIYSVSHSSTTPQLIHSGIPHIYRLAVEGHQMFVLQHSYPARYAGNIYRVDLSSGDTSMAVTGTDVGTGTITNLRLHSGILYWVTRRGLHRLNSDGSSQTLYSNDGGEVTLSGGDSRIIAIQDNLVVPPLDVSGKWLSHQVGTGVNTLITFSPNFAGGDFFGTDGMSVYSTNYRGISRAPADFRLRKPETVLANVRGLQGLLVKDAWIYWSQSDWPMGTQRIGRVQTDGSSPQVLFTGRHLGLELYNDRVYFVCNDCSIPGWALVSMPCEGGGIRAEVQLGDAPSALTRKGDIFYLTDRINFQYRLYAINIPLQRSVVVSDTRSSSSFPLIVSGAFVYTFAYSPERYQILDWNHYGPAQAVPVAGRRAHGTDNAIYWWGGDSQPFRKISD